MEISGHISKQHFTEGSGRKTLKNLLGNYFDLFKSLHFRLMVLRCTGFYSPVLTVSNKNYRSIGYREIKTL